MHSLAVPCPTLTSRAARAGRTWPGDAQVAARGGGHLRGRDEAVRGACDRPRHHQRHRQRAPRPAHRLLCAARARARDARHAGDALRGGSCVRVFCDSAVDLTPPGAVCLCVHGLHCHARCIARATRCCTARARADRRPLQSALVFCSLALALPRSTANAIYKYYDAVELNMKIVEVPAAVALTRPRRRGRAERDHAERRGHDGEAPREHARHRRPPERAHPTPLQRVHVPARGVRARFVRGRRRQGRQGRQHLPASGRAAPLDHAPELLGAAP
eukprot:338676-Rhodomonas_salina.4